MLYQRVPGAPPRDLFNGFAAFAAFATLVLLILLAGGSWERVVARINREAEVYEQLRPYSSASRALELLGPPQSQTEEAGFERWQYNRVEGLPGGAELWIKDSRVLRLFSLESAEHQSALRQALANHRN